LAVSGLDLGSEAIRGSSRREVLMPCFSFRSREEKGLSFWAMDSSVER
jgi:hypothetical protein